MLPDLSTERLIGMGRRMLLIRRFEERLVGLFDDRAFAGHYHLYCGQEATGVAALELLRPDDFVFSTHRNHGHNLARGVDPKSLMAEICGRAAGLSRGKGGTLHASDPERGILHTSGVVGSSLPMATGAALAGKQRGSQQISLCLFGDGALEEGAAYEALNLAALWKAPVVFVCENNCLEAHADIPGAWHTTYIAAKRLGDVAEMFGHATAAVDGGDVGAVSAAVTRAIEHARSGDGPSFIEAATIRWPGNYGLWPALPTGATDVRWAWGAGSGPQEFETWFRDHDPVLRYLRELLAAGVADQQTLVGWDRQFNEEVEAAAQFALCSPPAEADEARRHVFVEAAS